MVAKVSAKGRMVIPKAIRARAQIKTGDELDVGYSCGLVVMRKRRALTPARVHSLLLGGCQLPEMTSKDGDTVANAIKKVRKRA